MAVTNKYTLTWNEMQWFLFHKDKNLTEYEQANDITKRETEQLFDSPDLKYYALSKSDGTKTLIIVFRTSLHRDSWLYWVPSEHQANVLLHEFPLIYLGLQEHNAGQPDRIEQPQVQPQQPENSDLYRRLTSRSVDTKRRLKDY